MISNGVNRVNINSLIFCIFSKGTQPTDSIKPHVILKLAYKVKYISQINGGLVMFFGNSITFFWITWHNNGQYRKNQYKKKRTQTRPVSKVLDNRSVKRWFSY